MNEEAVILFQHLSILEFELGFINIDEINLRLRLIDELTESESPEWEDAVKGEINEDIRLEEGGITSETDASVEKNLGDDSKLMEFLTKDNSKVIGAKWKFHIADADFFPSIPHGHSNINDNLKLDSYTGFIYDTSAEKPNRKYIKRESKKYIIVLWNDPKFRIFALKTINWYMGTFPHYRWRVSNPKRLPKFK